MFKRLIHQLLLRIPFLKYSDPKSGFNTYLRLLTYLKPYATRAVISTLITVPIGSLDAAIAYSLRPYMDGVLVKQSVHSVTLVPLFIVGFTLLQGGLTYLSLYLNGWLGYNLVNDIRQALFEKLQSLDISYFDRTTSGAVIQYYYNEPQALQSNCLDTLRDFSTRLFSSISLMGVLLFTSWKLAIIAISILLCILFPSTKIKKIIRTMNSKMMAVATDAISFYNETVTGIRVIYGYNLSGIRADRFKQFQHAIFSAGMRYIKASGWLTPSMHLIASIGIAIIIFSGSKMVVNGQLTTGGFVSFLVALIMLYNPVKNLGGSILATQVSLISATRIFEVLDTQPNIKDEPDAVELNEIRQGIEFENVTFAYNPGVPVLKNINLSFRKGETVALVGNSGGGKSTVTSLIPRFYDVTEGTITIDGQDIRGITLSSLRDKISLVTQDNFLFNGTIRENLMLARPDATEEEVWDAVERAYLVPFINSLAEGLETRIGERGVLLSGGQKQRVAIARALLKNAPIVILDEATSALDNQSEAIVQKAIEALMVHRTVIVVAHRLSTIRNADRIVVLSEGQIVEEGSHEVLLAQDGVYASLYNTQFKTREPIQSQPTESEMIEAIA